MSTGGFGCGGTATSYYGYTVLDPQYIIDVSGKISFWCLTVGYSFAGPKYVKVKIFRGNPDTGATKIHDSGLMTLTDGYEGRTYNFEIFPAADVQAGDYVSLFSNDIGVVCTAFNSGYSTYFDSGDIDIFIKEFSNSDQNLRTKVWYCLQLSCFFNVS